MKLTTYYLNNSFEVEACNNKELKDDLLKRLKIVENEIIQEFLKKQLGKVGIKTLGNEIRYNKTIQQQFDYVFDDSVLLKLTENKRAFIKVFLDAIIKYPNTKIYFFILEDSFGAESNLVDKTFIRLSDIKKQLEKFFNHFSFNEKNRNIYFVEIKGFEDYNLISENGFTTIEKK